MSNGGYMSYHLACNLDNTFAAVVSVTGSMTSDTYDNCSPSHPTAAMQIHGIQDATVPYFGAIHKKTFLFNYMQKILIMILPLENLLNMRS